MQTGANLTVATRADRPSVVATLTLAFAADPLNRWWLPKGENFLKYFPALVEVFLEPALDAGTCFVTERITGAAIWYPPGVKADEDKLEALVGEFLPADIAAEAGALLEFFEEFHPKDENCWYLPLIGVDPGHRGKGYGAALMQHATALLDNAGAPGYLESSNPMNISLYQRHGFKVITQRQVGESVLVSPMQRAPTEDALA